ncbi:hypothetical protein V6N12_032549 [Hibiscus sabdariffa]|uniref:Uncharacterized protein n=1 Tax=Hibiscus sabdariffa TaxID=183260 RepID=A0ABR2CCX3_9ROSI
MKGEGEEAKFSRNLEEESTPTLETLIGCEKSAVAGKSGGEGDEAKFFGNLKEESTHTPKTQTTIKDNDEKSKGGEFFQWVKWGFIILKAAWDNKDGFMFKK